MCELGMNERFKNSLMKENVVSEFSATFWQLSLFWHDRSLSDINKIAIYLSLVVCA